MGTLILFAACLYGAWRLYDASFGEVRRREAAKKSCKAALEEYYKKAAVEREAKRLADQQRAAESARLSRILTSSNNSIRGRRIARQIRLVSIADERDKDEAERKFLLAVEQVGGNGVLNMRVRPHNGGFFSVQGDAVFLE